MNLLSLFSKPAKPENDLTAIFIGRNHPHLNYGMTGTAIWWVGQGKYCFWPDGGLLERHNYPDASMYLHGHDLFFPGIRRV